MITRDQYLEIANIVSNIQDYGGLALGPLLNVKTSLFSADINPRDRFRREFFAVLDSTYSFVASHYAVPNAPMRNFVRALNQHVLDFYGTKTIDEFLVDNEIRVPQSFANVSAYVGFPITQVLTDPADNWERFNATWESLSGH